MRGLLLIPLLLVASLSCSGEEPVPVSIQEVKQRHETELLKLPGVVSVGIGLNEAGEAAIVVGLEGADARTEATLPSTLGGYPVEVRTVGRLKTR